MSYFASSYLDWWAGDWMVLSGLRPSAIQPCLRDAKVGLTDNADISTRTQDSYSRKQHATPTRSSTT